MATKREIMNAIAAGTMNEEIMEWAKAQIEKMDAANEARRSKMSAKAKENEPIKKEIMAVLTEEPQTATVIGAAVKISTQKASALLRQLTEAGKVQKVEVKIKGKGTQKGYLVVAEEEVEG